MFASCLFSSRDESSDCFLDGLRGATDNLGFHVVEDPVHIHDLQATTLHLLGLDHERLTFTYQGREFRLTDVHGHVVKKILA